MKRAGRWYEDGLALPAWAAQDALQFLAVPDMLRAGPPVVAGSEVLLREPHPGDRSLLDTEPTIRGSDGCTVTIHELTPEGTERGAEVPVARDGESYRPVRPLERGRQYLVAVTIDGTEMGYAYRVLAAREADQARWALEHARRAPRASAMILERLGLSTTALGILDGLAEGDAVRAWRAELSRSVGDRLKNPGDPR